MPSYFVTVASSIAAPDSRSRTSVSSAASLALTSSMAVANSGESSPG